MPTKKTNRKISETLKKHRGRGNNHRPWFDRAPLVRRVIRVFEAFEGGENLTEIARREGIHFDTARLDVVRARELAVIALADTVEAKRAEHVMNRRKIQRTAMSDHDEAEVEDRAPFLRVVTDNETGIEELDGLRRSDDTPPPPPVVLIQFGGASPQSVEDLTDEQLLALDKQIETSKGNIMEAEFSEVD